MAGSVADLIAALAADKRREKEGRRKAMDFIVDLLIERADLRRENAELRRRSARANSGD